MPGSRREELLASAGDQALAAWLGRQAHKRVDRGSPSFRCDCCQYCCHDGDNAW